jgi:Sperm tail
MSYSLKQAAEASGRTKPTILRAIQLGKISAQKDDHGEWQIDPAELHRVYKPVTEVEPIDTSANDAAVQREIELLREMLSDKDKQIDRIVADKDRQIENLSRRLESVDEERRTTLRQLTALLTDQRAKTAPDVIVTPPPISDAPPAAPAPAAPPAGNQLPAEETPATVKRKGLLDWLTG